MPKKILKKLKIVQLISSSATSGAERHVIDLTVHLISRGHEVVLMCPEDGWVPQTASEFCIPAMVCPMKGKSWLSTISKLNEMVLSEQFNVIHTHLTRAAYLGFASSKMTGCPVVTSVHIANNDRIYNRIAKRNNRLVAVSGFVHGMLHGRGIPEKFIDTVYNGTDFLDFPISDSSRLRKEFGINGDVQLIGQIGRISPQKGQIDLLKALSKVKRSIKNIHGLFVGRFDGEYESEIRQRVATLGLENHVTFTGLRHDIPELIDACDFVAVPSKMETFGLAAVEAMARSKAVVAARVGALPEVILDGRTGLLYDLDSDQLPELLSYLLKEPRIRDEMGAFGKQVAMECFSLSQMTDRIEEVYGKTQA